jgi:hypothetical protein
LELCVGASVRTQRRARAATATKGDRVRPRSPSRIQVSPGRLEIAIIGAGSPQGLRFSHASAYCSFRSIWSSCDPVQIYRACMSRSAHDRADEADGSAALRPGQVALVHERFAEEHEAAAESLSGDLAEAHRGAADKHEQAASEDRRQAQTAREEADAEHD